LNDRGQTVRQGRWRSVDVGFPGKFARKTTTKWLKFGGTFWSICALSPRFLRAMIVEWSFLMLESSEK
jgi:hypothetical protein